MENGLIHIYTGEGKGKTTAAIGLAVRAAGHGLRVGIYQLCKGADTGELHSLAKLDCVSLHRANCDIKKFIWEMSDQQRAQWRAATRTLFEKASRAAAGEGTDLVILDEVFGAMSAGAIDEGMIEQLMRTKGRGVELVLTGRNAPESLIALSDYVTEMRCVKHPYSKGIGARRGIEL